MEGTGDKDSDGPRADGADVDNIEAVRPSRPEVYPWATVMPGRPLPRRGMAGLLRLARPLNAGMSAVGVAVGGVVAVGPAAWGPFALPLVLACAAAAAFTAGGNALNDIYDRETDRVNHPDRPLASGQLTVETAWAFVAASFGGAAVLGALVNAFALGLVAVNALVMISYESGLKARGISGNVVIAFLVGSLFLFSGLAVYRGPAEPLVRSGVLASLAFLTTLGREVTKDIEDLAGDVDRRTLPRRIGARAAGAVAAFALFASVGLGALPLLLQVLGWGYAILVIPADGMFIYAALHSAANPSRSQRATKYGMIVALAAFLAGAFA
jgi:geranylgeranylglycerol-phosphate geranylgeranyltransferase